VDDKLVDRTLDALERLIRIFRLERVLFLASSIVSFALIIFVAYKMFDAPGGAIQHWQVAVMLGSSGVLAGTSMRVVYFLNKAFNLIEYLVRRRSDAGEA
jgi:hypothetical protein